MPGEDILLNMEETEEPSSSSTACRKAVCNILAEFYENLYKVSDADRSKHRLEQPRSDHPRVTVEEVRDTLRALKTNKASSDDGLVAEMLQTENPELLDFLAALFDDLLALRQLPPNSWKVARVSVLFKKGDPELPQNYRPLSIISVMAKTFSTLVYRRIRNFMDKKLPDEQFGFRPGRGCADAMFVLRMVTQKSEEWGEELWLAGLDVEKAFDKGLHSSLFEALHKEGLELEVAEALKELYSGLQAFV